MNLKSFWIYGDNTKKRIFPKCMKNGIVNYNMGFEYHKYTLESLTNQINDIIKIIISNGFMVDIYNIKLFNLDNDVLKHYYKLKLVVKIKKIIKE
jgi:hypothetical protein